jgi:hypothetical protein
MKVLWRDCGCGVEIPTMSPFNTLRYEATGIRVGFCTNKG